MPNRFVVCDVPIDAVPLEEAVSALSGRQLHGAVHLCNAYTLSLAMKDPALRTLLNARCLNLPDGMPLIWIAKRLGLRNMSRRVYGPDLMEMTLDHGREVGLRHFLYGSTPEVLAKLQSSIADRWPGAIVAGAESPPFTALTESELFDAYRRFVAVEADVVWVGLGTPQQDVVVQQLQEVQETHAMAFVAIGAAFDFIAGTKRQAPAVLQRYGMEWSFRLISEPRRMWRRYLIGNLKFLWGCARSKPKRLPDTLGHYAGTGNPEL